MSPVIAIVHSGKLASDNATWHRQRPTGAVLGPGAGAADCDNHPKSCPARTRPARVPIRRSLVPEPPPYLGLWAIPVQNASRRGDSRRLQSGATANRSRCRRWNFPPAQIAVLFQFIRIG